MQKADAEQSGAAAFSSVKNTEENSMRVSCRYRGGRERSAAVSYRKRNTERSQNEKEERKMSIDWEELLDAEGEDIGDAYDEAVDDAIRWMEGYDD